MNATSGEGNAQDGQSAQVGLSDGQGTSPPGPPSGGAPVQSPPPPPSGGVSAGSPPAPPRGVPVQSPSAPPTGAAEPAAPSASGHKSAAGASNSTTQTIGQLQISGCTSHCRGADQTQIASQQNLTVQATDGGWRMDTSSSPSQPGEPSSGASRQVEQVQIGCMHDCHGSTSRGTSGLGPHALEQLLLALGALNVARSAPVSGAEQNSVKQTTVQVQDGTGSSGSQAENATQVNLTIQTVNLSSLPGYIVAALGIPDAPAVNRTTQAIAQVQIGCLFYCEQTQQIQLATQSNATVEAAPAAVAVSDATEAGAVDLVSQLIWQVQIGCLAWCWDTTQEQSASNRDTLTVIPTPSPLTPVSPSPDTPVAPAAAPTPAPRPPAVSMLPPPAGPAPPVGPASTGPAPTSPAPVTAAPPAQVEGGASPKSQGANGVAGVAAAGSWSDSSQGAASSHGAAAAHAATSSHAAAWSIEWSGSIVAVSRTPVAPSELVGLRSVVGAGSTAALGASEDVAGSTASTGAPAAVFAQQLAGARTDTARSGRSVEASSSPVRPGADQSATADGTNDLFEPLAALLGIVAAGPLVALVAWRGRRG